MVVGGCFVITLTTDYTLADCALARLHVMGQALATDILGMCVWNDCEQGSFVCVMELLERLARSSDGQVAASSSLSVSSTRLVSVSGLAIGG